MSLFGKNTNSESLFHLFSKKWRLPGEKVQDITKTLSFTERLFFGLLIALFTFSSFFLLWQVSKAFTVEVPEDGGTLIEGIVGSPRFINPLLAETDADKDLSTLVYSGLLKATPEGDLINDLSESYSVSDDGLIYTFRLKENIYFHNGTSVTAEDVEFTILKAQDPILKSPRRINWEGVKVEVLNNREIQFILPQAYTPFLENATMGILPKDLWKNLETDQFAASLFNMEPIGSGPYKIKKIKRGSDGLPLYYELRAFSKYALGKPYIKNLVIKMFSNEEDLIEALNKKQVDSANSISPKEAVAFQERKDINLIHTTLPRIFGAFFNQNQAEIFASKEVREALELAVDKKEFIEKILEGYGAEIDSPIPVGYLEGGEIEELRNSDRISEAKKILENSGWEIDEDSGIWHKETKNDELSLSFSISTHDVADLKIAAEILKEQWERLGAKVEVKIFDRSDLTHNIIRPRRYDVLLFGTIIGRDLDFFPFWHSSQRNDPGLNVALYANIKADKLLEEARVSGNKEERLSKYKDFEEIVKNDQPAVFIYSPDFIYLTPSKVKNIKIGHITTPNERFLNVEEWHIETNKVWKIFAQKTN